MRVGKPQTRSGGRPALGLSGGSTRRARMYSQGPPSHGMCSSTSSRTPSARALRVTARRLARAASRAFASSTGAWALREEKAAS